MKNNKFYGVMPAVFCIAACLFFSGCFLSETRPVIDDAAFIREIEKKWDTVKVSRSKAWVDYNYRMDTRSEVDFDKGIIEFETLVIESDKSMRKIGEKKIAAQMEKVFKTKTSMKISILRGQIKNRKGKIVKKKNLKRYIKKEVLPKIKLHKRRIIANDGIRRVRMNAKINLVTEHSKVRAEQYVSIIKKVSARFNLSPHLLMAIIHNESNFNPMAISHCGAIGLMQLIPHHGAKEAYKYLYKKDKVLTREYLFNPVNNIELGSAYYYILKSKYFKTVKNSVNKRYLSICAYNLGPTRVRKIAKKYNLNRMKNRKLYSILQKKTPKETRDYLRDVINVAEKYRELFFKGR